jgi:uncharacterized membrane protein
LAFPEGGGSAAQHGPMRIIGGVAGTLGGYECRARLAKAMGRDIPVALLDDALAILVALIVVMSE